jgi:hypothetical protein
VVAVCRAADVRVGLSVRPAEQSVVIVGALILLAGGAFVAYFPEQAGRIARTLVDLGSGGRSPATDPSDGPLWSADLEVGMCLTLDPREDKQISGALPVVGCAKTHASEVIGTFTMPKGAYPGADGIRREADKKCPALLGDYVKVTAEMASYAFGYLAPSRAQWALGNRVVACLVIEPDGKRKGSIKH